MTSLEDYMTAEKVASVLKVKPYTVRDLAKSGALRGMKPGRRWLFDPADVTAYLEAGQNRAPERRRRRRAA